MLRANPRLQFRSAKKYLLMFVKSAPVYCERWPGSCRSEAEHPVAFAEYVIT